MAAAKINTHWDEDIYGNSILVVEKGRGKLNFDEVADLLRYDWKLQGHYVMLINATEATCGVDWDPFGEIEKKSNGNQRLCIHHHLQARQNTGPSDRQRKWSIQIPHRKGMLEVARIFRSRL